MSQLLNNEAATGSWVVWGGGAGVFSCAGTFGGATVTLQYMGADSATAVSAGPDTVLTAAGLGSFSLPPGKIRAEVSGGAPSGLYASAEHVKDGSVRPGSSSVQIADGADAAIGAKADTAATSDTGTFSLIALFKRLLQKLAGPATGTATQVASTTVEGVILAANSGRKGATIINDDANILYLLLSATGAASSTVYSVAISGGGGYYELPVCQGGVYTGQIRGVWSADGSGSARVTEFTA